MGLIVGHAYSVIAVATVVGSDGKKTNIVQVRNPWGAFEWNGEWSDNSDKWTAAAAKKVKLVKDDDDGTFWMSFLDFKQYFSMVFISPYEDDYVFDNVMVPHPVRQDGKYLFQMNIHHSGGYTIAVSQKDKRCLPLSCKYSYARSVKIFVILETVKNKQKEYTLVKSAKQSWKRDVYVPFTEESLKKGKYWVLVRVQWDDFDRFQNDLTLSLNTYGCAHTTLTHDDETSQEKFLNVAQM